MQRLPLSGKIHQISDVSYLANDSVESKWRYSMFEKEKGNVEYDAARVVIVGDINEDGLINVTDQAMLIGHVIGKEIIDGKLTGKIVSPLIMTGYVPDVLNSISMVSKDFQLYGTGSCGKGYKEWVKTSVGGPYMKVTVKLG